MFKYMFLHTHIHYFTHTYFQKIQITLSEQRYPTTPETHRSNGPDQY